MKISLVTLEVIVRSDKDEFPLGEYEHFTRRAAGFVIGMLRDLGEKSPLHYSINPETCAAGYLNVRIAVERKPPDEIVEAPSRG